MSASPDPADTADLATRLLDCQLVHRDSRNVPLRDVVKEGRISLVVFLRHFGCIGCAEHVQTWLPRLYDFAKWDVDFVFIGNGEARYLDAFSERHGLEDKPVTLLTDPSLAIYETLGLKRSALSTFGFHSLKNAIRAFGKGILQTSIEGDPTQQGGLLLFDRARKLRHVHRERSIGDFMDPSDLLSLVLQLTEQKRGVL